MTGRGRSHEPLRRSAQPADHRQHTVGFHDPATRCSSDRRRRDADGRSQSLLAEASPDSLGV